MDLSTLIKEFEKKFGQSPMYERKLLNTRKTKFFFQVINEDLKNKLLFYLVIFHEYTYLF